jgi:hypothetical protein
VSGLAMVGMDGWEAERKDGEGSRGGCVVVRGRWRGWRRSTIVSDRCGGARFRFVSAAVLGLRYGVSVQQVNARLRRLEAAGLVARTDGAVARARLVSVTARGCRAVEAPVRRAARTDLQREHELELAWLVARLELLGDGAAVRIERESRVREAAGAAGRYSVDVIDRGGRRERRWPDLVIEGPHPSPRRDVGAHGEGAVAA